MPGSDAGADAGSAEALLTKLRAFVDALDADERRLLAALLAPGVAAAWDDGPEVSGFGVDWDASRLPQHLAASIRAHNLRIEGW